jgi:poly-gamma-glutamate capsule biosynthesis protein CapA/YwtB (metallophosphatase superfamily)
LFRWSCLTQFLFTFCVAVTAGKILLGGSDGADEAPGLEAAYDPGPSATRTAGLDAPEAALLYIDMPSDVSSPIEALLGIAAEGLGIEVRPAGTLAGATLTVLPHETGVEGSNRASFVVETWLAVASVWSLQATFDPSQPASMVLLLPEERRASLEAILGVAASSPAVRWMPLAGIGPALEADATAVAVLPLETVTSLPRVRTLRWQPEGTAWLEQRATLSWPAKGWDETGRSLTLAIDSPAPALTTIAFTGDIIPARCVYERQRNLDDYTAAFAYVAEYLSSVDLTIGSLDASISDAGEPYSCEETFNLLAPPRSIEGLVAAGFDVMTVATNHAKDCGKTGFGCGQSIRDTLANLRAAGIEPVGGGEDIAEARRPAVVERNGVRFAFLAYDDVASAFYAASEDIPGTATLSEQALREDVEAAGALADVVIVLPQWGAEYTPTPTDRQVHLGRVALEAGATLVVGNHPHVVQGVEGRAGHFIAYALGNFVFDQDWSLETQQGAVLEATFAGEQLLGVALKPVRILNMFQPTLAEEGEAASILERMRASSEALVDR